MDKLQQEVVPILILCAAIAVVVRQLPKVDVGHTPGFLRRRTLNWLPLGLTYAFLYMGRYNMTVLKNVQGISQHDFGNIDFWGSLVYGVSFLVNGPFADRFGGRRTILLAAGGALVANTLIGLLWITGRIDGHSTLLLGLLFSLNMYFQSFGAVSIVKVNASWFHLRERGTFGGIFGILISLGLYFAFDWGSRIALAGCPGCGAKGPPPAADLPGLGWLFLVPAAILTLFWGLSFVFVRDTPAHAGLEDFDVADASSGEPSGHESSVDVIVRMLRNPIILTIAIIELCSGFLRQGILKWSGDFAKGIGAAGSYVNVHWGMVSCIAGITGGMFAGVISDHLFHSRRPPVSTVLYLIMLVGSIALVPLLGAPVAVSWIIAFMAMAIIGVHGMLSGVASQDFGGRLHTGVAVGLIDGFVYLGTALQDQVYGGYGSLLPEKGTAAAKLVSNWQAWPIAMVPVAVIGLLLSLRLWNVRVKTNPPVATLAGGQRPVRT
ncbi:MAG TPA: MFS transporter [Kofleriaceae bacterium]|jgi:OPA family glycerol-3-phosphate transporter-like MFS transporter|nr:MFS transporter [Kofleriaceae bacterium]